MWLSQLPQFSLQAQYIVAVLSERKKLPSEEEMNADEENDFQEKLSSGLCEKYAHTLGDRQWDYNNTIAQLAGVVELGAVYEEIFEHVEKRREDFLMDYKGDEFELTSDGMWAIVKQCSGFSKVEHGDLLVTKTYKVNKRRCYLMTNYSGKKRS